MLYLASQPKLWEDGWQAGLLWRRECLPSCAGKTQQPSSLSSMALQSIPPGGLRLHQRAPRACCVWQGLKVKELGMLKSAWFYIFIVNDSVSTTKILKKKNKRGFVLQRGDYAVHFFLYCTGTLYFVICGTIDLGSSRRHFMTRFLCAASSKTAGTTLPTRFVSHQARDPPAGAQKCKKKKSKNG